MIYKFFILLLFNISDTIDIPYFKDIKITLDGKLKEEVYNRACKIPNLVQTLPEPYKEPPESTIIFLLQTDGGLFLGIHALTKNREPDRSSSGDEISIYLDTYFDKENAYMFSISANEGKLDARISSGGEKFDYSVDFSWEGKVYCGKNYFEIEIFIPWKGIMGKKGKWGIDIERTWPGRTYRARLAPFDENKEKFHISRFKVIKFVNLNIKLLTTEIQPIFLLHHGKDFEYRYNFKYEIGSNIYFKFKENIKFAFTFNPDFGEVEADPFRLNLTKYPLFYSETRPFFCEGKEFFQLSGFSPFNVFYSRQIGKTLYSGKTIPISFAGKFLIKSNFLELSTLFARIEETEELFTIYPRTDFFVSKIRVLPYESFSISLLQAHRFPYKEKIKGLIGTQLFYNDSLTSLDIESVFDNYVSKDFASKIEFEKIIKSCVFSLSLIHIPDSFSDNEVGFIPWKGERSLNLSSNYKFFINKKILYFKPGVIFYYYKELSEPYMFTVISDLTFTLNNFTTVAPSIGYKKDFEMGKKFESPYFHTSLSNLFLTLTKNKFYMFIETQGYKMYNYSKNYIGWVNINSLLVVLNLKNFSIIGGLSQWNEFNPFNKLDETTYTLNLRMSLNLPCRFYIKFYCDFPISNAGILRERAGIYVSWNFFEKNYVKAVYNDFRIKTGEEWESEIQKITIKLMPSFYF